MMTENEYRSIDKWSYSTIKDFKQKGLLYFYKKHVLREKVKESKSGSLTRGKAVDSLIFDGEGFYDKFYVGSNENSVTGKGLTFVEKLFEYTLAGGEFWTNFQRAYVDAELQKPSVEKYLENFKDSALQSLYESMLSSFGKEVLSIEEFHSCEKVVTQLRSCSHTSHIFSCEGFNQLPVEFEYKGFKLKALLDRVVIDHKNKKISPYDLKCVDDVNGFEFKWLKDMYYVQEGLYTLAIEEFRDCNFPEYEIEKFKFIVCQQDGFQSPLIYDICLPVEGLGDLFEGFTTSMGKKFKGIDEYLTDMKWHVENNVWDMTRESYRNKGILRKTI